MHISTNFKKIGVYQQPHCPYLSPSYVRGAQTGFRPRSTTGFDGFRFSGPDPTASLGFSRCISCLLILWEEIQYHILHISHRIFSLYGMANILQIPATLLKAYLFLLRFYFLKYLEAA